MDKLPVGQLPDLQQSNNDDEIMVITNSEHNQLKKEKISDLITDFTSTDENNALTKGTDGKMFVTDFGNASNITEGTLPTSVLPDIPKSKLPDIETADLPLSGVTADTYAYPSSVTVNAQGQVTAISEGSPSGANADTNLSNLTDEGEKHFLNKTQITNCILEAPNGVVEWSGVTPTGTLVNNQGVVSGFSKSNYGLIDKTPPSNITSYEFMSTFTTGAQQDVYQGIFANSYTNGATAQMTIINNNLFIQHPKDASTWIEVKTTTPLLTNTTYQAKGIWDGSNLSLYYKTNEENEFTFVGTTPVSTIYWVEPIGVGCDLLGTSSFLGSIDLSQSYIKINGKMWWQGNDLGFNQFRVKEGLKTLTPNGRNENGTLRNIENNVSEDLIYTFEDNATGSCWAAVGDIAARLFKMSWKYDEDENYIVGLSSTTKGRKSLTTMIGDMEVKNGNIISLTPYQPVQLASWDDISKYNIAYIVETFHVEFSDAQEGGANWYRIWSDGFIEQGGYVPPGATKTTVTFLVPYKHNNTINVQVSESMINEGNYDTGGYDLVCAVQNITVNNFYVSCQNRIFNWRACGY